VLNKDIVVQFVDVLIELFRNLLYLDERLLIDLDLVDLMEEI
jgi:hypothetical protein